MQINTVLQEVERTFFFTDVPEGALKTHQQPCNLINDSVEGNWIWKVCGEDIHGNFCFTDLDDIDQATVNTMKEEDEALPPPIKFDEALPPPIKFRPARPWSGSTKKLKTNQHQTKTVKNDTKAEGASKSKKARWSFFPKRTSRAIH